VKDALGNLRRQSKVLGAAHIIGKFKTD